LNVVGFLLSFSFPASLAVNHWHYVSKHVSEASLSILANVVYLVLSLSLLDHY